MTFFAAIRTGFRKYADFTGTSRRSEFWWWVLFTMLVGAAVDTIADAATGGDTAFGAVWSIAVFLPSLAVTVRRLRDAGFGWGHVFWLLLPFAGVVVIAVLCSQAADRRPTAQPVGTAETVVTESARS